MLKTEETLKKLPDFNYDKNLLNEELKEEIKRSNKQIIALDDDPTGTQTVHDIYVYTSGSESNIEAGFTDENNCFYVLTNSRSFTEKKTKQYHKEIGKTIEQISKKYDKDYILISRSDSTLRGHFPLETATLKESIESVSNKRIDGEIIIPFFQEGGRYTINDEHYVDTDGILVRASDTEFAKDRSFGYKSSNMYEYIEEKTNGKYTKDTTTSITINELRNKDIDGIVNKLLNVNDFSKVFVNCADYYDLKVFCLALYKVIDKKNFIFRTAASFVKTVAGISTINLLTKEKLVSDTNNGGIIAIGSHTDKTNRQLEKLKELDNIELLEFNSDLVIDDKKLNTEIERIVSLENELINKGRNVVIYTKRTYFKLPNDTKNDELNRSVKISKSLSKIVNSLEVTPKFVVAKGGITSSDIATDALELKKAIVLGQIYPAVPVWKTPKESKFAGVSLVIFPGNVGDDNTLKESIEKMS